MLPTCHVSFFVSGGRHGPRGLSGPKTSNSHSSGTIAAEEGRAGAAHGAQVLLNFEAVLYIADGVWTR